MMSSDKLQAMSSDKLQANILSTYFTLRLGIVVLSVALPLVLYFGGLWFGGIPYLGSSMSAYYGENGGTLRNWLVGILWAVGSFLYLYKGFSLLENVLLNLAGGFAVGIAMVPCNCWRGAVGGSNKLHVFVAVSFFLAMAAVCLFCAGETISLLPTKAQQDAFKRRYRIIGVVLVLSPLAAIAASYVLEQHPSYKFFIEAFGVWTFAYYWWTKSREFRITSAEKRAVCGELKNVPPRGVVAATGPAPLGAR
jgi:hypothetical protein